MQGDLEAQRQAAETGDYHLGAGPHATNREQRRAAERSRPEGWGRFTRASRKPRRRSTHAGRRRRELLNGLEAFEAGQVRLHKFIAMCQQPKKEES